MTILSCTATKCMYNDNELCSRGEIEVNGTDARQANETSCGSFREKGSDSFMNSAKEHCGCEKINIDCKAQECTYNEHCHCTASAIDISGCNAHNCKETKCDTFACKC